MVVRGSRSWVLGGSDTGQIVSEDLSSTRWLASAGDLIQRVAMQGGRRLGSLISPITLFSARSTRNLCPFHREAIVTPGRWVLQLGAEL